jgi:hypothetical protein
MSFKTFNPNVDLGPTSPATTGTCTPTKPMIYVSMPPVPICPKARNRDYDAILILLNTIRKRRHDAYHARAGLGSTVDIRREGTISPILTAALYADATPMPAPARMACSEPLSPLTKPSRFHAATTHAPARIRGRIDASRVPSSARIRRASSTAEPSGILENHASGDGSLLATRSAAGRRTA